MIFDPENCIVVVQTYPTGQCDMDITACLLAKGVPVTAVQRVNARDTISARNFAVRNYVLGSGKGELLMFDADMKPEEIGTRRFWDAEADIVGAYYPCGGMDPWKNDNVHCGMMRVNAEVFETLPAPWFQLVRTPDGCEMIDCECNYLTKRARAAGFTVAQAGYCGHEGKHDGCTAPY